jgi:hypothetical protein
VLQSLRLIHDPLPLFMLPNIQTRPYKNGEGVIKQKSAKKGVGKMQKNIDHAHVV